MLAMGKPTWSSQLLWSLLEHNFGTTRTFCAVRRAPRIDPEGHPWRLDNYYWKSCSRKAMSSAAIHHQLDMWTNISFCQCTNVRHAICCVFVSSLLFVLICGFVFNIPLHGLCHVFFVSAYWHQCYFCFIISWLVQIYRHVLTKLCQCLFHLCSHMMFLMFHDLLSAQCVGSCLSCLSRGCIAICC